MQRHFAFASLLVSVLGFGANAFGEHGHTEGIWNNAVGRPHALKHETGENIRSPEHPQPQTSCTANSPTGKSCTASCPNGSTAHCTASATEVYCDCTTGDEDRAWGPVTGIGEQQLLLCHDFAAFLRSNDILSPRTAALAADVDSTIAAVNATSQGRYAAACDAYVDHEALLTQTERDSIDAWRSRNNPWAGKPAVGRYIAAAGNDVSLAAAPNPFAESITITYTLPAGSPVRIAVYDISGALVTTLEAGEQNAGQYTLLWNAIDAHGRTVPAGTYLLRLTTPNTSHVQKLEIRQ